MYLKKLTITAPTAGATTREAYSAGIGNGVVYAVEYKPGGLATTAAFTVARESMSTDADAQFLTSVTATTDNLFYWPRHKVIDSTGATIGASTDYPVAHYYMHDERVKVSVVGATCNGGSATWTVYLQGA